MEEKRIFTIEFDKPVKLIKLDKEGLEFSDGTKITDYHDQDCCEYVYADWEQLSDTGIMEEEFRKIRITGNPLLGIVLNGTYAVPCYNSQNGYYSSSLSIIVNQEGRPEITIDISGFVKDDID